MEEVETIVSKKNSFKYGESISKLSLFGNLSQPGIMNREQNNWITFFENVLQVKNVD